MKKNATDDKMPTFAIYLIFMLAMTIYDYWPLKSHYTRRFRRSLRLVDGEDIILIKSASYMR